MKAWLDARCPVAFCGLMGVWKKDLVEAPGEAATLPGILMAEAKILEWGAVRLFRSADPRHPSAFCARAAE